jgi:hypothetical protein
MSCNNTSCNGCFHNQLELFVQSQEDVWETDSDASEADASEADASDSYESFIEREVAKIQTAALGEGVDFSDDESEFSPEEPKKEEKPPLFKAPIELGECPICYEELKMIDFTVTKCGHTFHSSCVFQALANNLDCPMCRCQLLEVQEDEEDEDQEDDDQEDDDQDDEDQEDDQEEKDSRPTMEQLATKLQNMGYTPVDFLTLFMGDILKRQDATRQTEEFLETFNEKIDDIVDGKITMAHVDQRSYAQVASQIKDSVLANRQQQQAV